jgi:hypothetical protein
MAPDEEMEEAPGTETEASEHIHFGEAQRVEKSDMAAGVARGNITLLDETAETMSLPQVTWTELEQVSLMLWYSPSLGLTWWLYCSELCMAP